MSFVTALDRPYGNHRQHFSCPCSSFLLLRLAVCLCKPVGLAAWPLVQRPTLTVNILYPTWQVESSSWPCASFQEHIAICTARGGWTPPCILQSCGREDIYLFACFTGEGTKLLSVSECKLHSVFTRFYPVFLEDLSIMCTRQAGRTASNPGSELLSTFLQRKRKPSLLLPIPPLCASCFLEYLNLHL